MHCESFLQYFDLKLLKLFKNSSAELPGQDFGDFGITQYNVCLRSERSDLIFLPVENSGFNFGICNWINMVAAVEPLSLVETTQVPSSSQTLPFSSDTTTSSTI